MVVYRNSHTTSTKCQYHAAHSNPMMWDFVFTMFLSRVRAVIRNRDPIRT